MMNSIKFIILWFFTFAVTIVNAQDEKPAAFWTNRSTTDFKTIQEATEAYYKDRYKGRGSGYKQWKRWEHQQETKLSPDGQTTNFTALNSEAAQIFLKENPNNQGNRMALNQWANWGENNSSTGLPGTGVINCVAFDNNDPNIIYAGGPACGLWKTTNGGTTWNNITDNLLWAFRGITSIAVDPLNDNIIYILTGDGDGGDSPSMGVFKSTNGGATWNPTGLFWNASDNKYGYKIAINPVNPTIIAVATSQQGIYMSYNAGLTWTNFGAGTTFYDMVWKPGSIDVLYASTTTSVYKSTDSGVNFSLVATIPLSQRTQLAVTPSNPNYVYAFGSGYVNWPGTGHGFPGLIRSTDNGVSWDYQSSTPAICSYSPTDFDTQATYNIDFAIKPTNTTTLVMGAINVHSSTNSGANWTQRTQWYDNDPPNQYVHSDIHGIEYNPLNNKLYIVCDGGIYVSDDDGLTYQDITNNMQLNAFFDLAGTPQNSVYMIGGLYHNGTRKFRGTQSSPSIGDGDGTGCMMDHSNNNTLYFSAQKGYLNRTLNGGFSSQSIKPSIADGPFVTKMAMSPVNSFHIYAGWTKDTIFRSTNQGTSWAYSLVPGSQENIKYIDVAPNGTTVYACTNEAVFRSLNAGATWSAIYTNGNGFTSVRALLNNSNKAIITRGGYVADDKVYLYDNGTITNITHNLPNIPINISEVSYNSLDEEVYVGTDIGVFKLPALYSSTWSLFGTNIINIPIVDLVIYPNHSVIRAATYGRGLLTSEITCADLLILTESNDPNTGIPSFQYNQSGYEMFVSRKIITTNSYVVYKAGSSVILQDGFRAVQGNTVIIKTAPCGVE